MPDFRPGAFVVTGKGREIQPFNDLDNKTGEMNFRQIILHRGRVSRAMGLKVHFFIGTFAVVHGRGGDYTQELC